MASTEAFLPLDEMMDKFELRERNSYGMEMSEIERPLR